MTKKQRANPADFVAAWQWYAKFILSTQGPGSCARKDILPTLRQCVDEGKCDGMPAIVSALPNLGPMSNLLHEWTERLEVPGKGRALACARAYIVGDDLLGMFANRASGKQQEVLDSLVGYLELAKHPQPVLDRVRELAVLPVIPTHLYIVMLFALASGNFMEAVNRCMVAPARGVKRKGNILIVDQLSLAIETPDTGKVVLTETQEEIPIPTNLCAEPYIGRTFALHRGTAFALLTEVEANTLRRWIKRVASLNWPAAGFE